RIRIRNEDRRADSLELPQTFVVHKEKCLILPDRSAEAASKLVPPKWRIAGTIRLGGRIEVIARVQPVIAKEFVNGAVKLVRAGFADRIQNGAVSSELRAVSGGQRLKLGNRFNTKRASGGSGADTVAKKPRYVGI